MNETIQRWYDAHAGEAQALAKTIWEHPEGGLAEITTYKWLIEGEGQVRA